MSQNVSNFQRREYIKLNLICLYLMLRYLMVVRQLLLLHGVKI
jgi:hypothetical protein